MLPWPPLSTSTISASFSSIPSFAQTFALPVVLFPSKPFIRVTIVSVLVMDRIKEVRPSYYLCLLPGTPLLCPSPTGNADTDPCAQKMSALRVEADASAAQVEELKAKIKTLEQDSLAKEQEITSLTHQKGVLEKDIEKLEGGIKDAKATAEASAQHGTQNESLTRKLQLLEEEAEESDRNLRETNEKLVSPGCPFVVST